MTQDYTDWLAKFYGRPAETVQTELQAAADYNAKVCALVVETLLVAKEGLK